MKVFSQDIGFTEGPVVCQDGAVAVTAIDRGQVAVSRGGAARILAETGGGPNGLVEARDGYYVAQNGGAWPATTRTAPGVQRIEAGGRVDRLAGGMVAPNDLAIGPDGLLYVTDPTRKPERDEGRIWTVDPATGETRLFMTCDWYPNGIGFGPDPDWVHVADTGGRRLVRVPREHPSEERLEVVFTMPHGLPDGFAFDADGRIVVAAVGAEEDEPGTVQVWSPDGRCEVLDPGGSRFITNVALDAAGRLYVCDSGNNRLLVHDHGTPGLPLHPFRA